MARFLFVGGSQRSGTTLLQSMLCKDPATTPQLAEASYLRALMQACQLALQDFNHDSASYFNNEEDLRTFHGGIVYSFLERTLARFPGASTLVLKEPHLTALFPLLAGVVPEARFILIMRDPRDIIASMLDVGARMKESGQSHFFQQRDMHQLSQYINSFYAPALNQQGPSFQQRYLVVRYEDLVLHSDEVRQRLAAFTGLGLEFNPASVTTKKALDGSSSKSRYQPWFTVNSGRAINDSSIGRYQQVLSEAETAEVNEHCADLLGLFKYR